MKLFDIRWIIKGKLTLLPKNNMDAVPRMGECVIANSKSYIVEGVTWRLDQPDKPMGQAVHVALREVEV